jgi:uncharacterized protein (TIGR01244 family)
MRRSPTSFAAVLGVALLGTIALAPPAAAQAAAAPAPPLPELLLNQRQPAPGLLTGGFRSTADFAALAGQGFETYIDLRGQDEVGPEVAAAAGAAGIAYVHIPIGGEADLDLVAVRKLDQALHASGGSPLVLACASGNRSGALLALRAFWLAGVPAEEALALGKRAGLTRLEPAVRTLLGLAPPPRPLAETPSERPAPLPPNPHHPPREIH